jgi:hypothetical protein
MRIMAKRPRRLDSTEIEALLPPDVLSAMDDPEPPGASDREGCVQPAVLVEVASV